MTRRAPARSSIPWRGQAATKKNQVKEAQEVEEVKVKKPAFANMHALVDS